MAVYEVKVSIPVTIHADSAEEAMELAMKKVIFERKDLKLSSLQAEPPKQVSMF
jgi:hypothetical protein